MVVVFNQKVETNVINEFYKAGIPILSFNCKPLNMPKITYKTLGNFKFVETNLRTAYFFILFNTKKTPVNKKKTV